MKRPSLTVRPFRLLFQALVLITGLHWNLGVTAAAANEKLGELGVSGIFLEPTYSFTEARDGGFEIGRAFIGATWVRDSLLSAQVKIGTLSLLGQPTWYGVSRAEEFGLIEAYAELDSSFGRFRGGLIPIPFGLEGGDVEERLRFPRHEIFQRRLVNLRDLGLGFHILNEGFFSDWAIHNGEGGRDLDSEQWFTFRVGHQGGQFLRLGVSGATGRTRPESTNPLVNSSSALAGLDVSRISRIRLANAYLGWEDGRFRLNTEITAGDVRQDEDIRKFRGWHMDLEYDLGGSFGTLARYDMFDPTSDVEGDGVDRYSIGLAIKSLYENSVLYLIGTKQVREGEVIGEHEALLLWRITPLANNFRSIL